MDANTNIMDITMILYYRECRQVFREPSPRD